MPSVDLDEARRYLEALDPTTDRFTFQTFGDHPKDPRLARVLHGTLAEHAPQLSRLNDDGAGIFVTVNATNFQGRAKENITALRHLFVDFDDRQATPALPPSIVVRAARGDHWYWRLGPGEGREDREAFSHAQKQLAAFYGSDPSINDTCRVMRVPGFLHRKREPTEVKLISSAPGQYTIAEVLAAHPVAPRAAQPQPPQRPVGRRSPALKRASAYLAKIEPAVEGSGGDLKTWQAALAVVIGFDLTDDEAFSLLASEYNPRCSPPWDEKDLRRKVVSAGRDSRLPRGYLLNARPDTAAPAPAAGPSPGFNLTDLGNAERLAHDYNGSLKYVHSWDKWLMWDGRRWAIDAAGRILQYAKATVRRIYREAETAESPAQAKAVSAHATKSEGNGRIMAMLMLAKGEPALSVTSDALDTDPWLLNVANGILNLKTGRLEPHRREAMCSKVVDVAYDPAAKAPLWLAFLDRIMDGDQEMIGFLRRAVGYSLTGVTTEQCLFVMHGTGSNGKGVFLNTVKALMGDYGQQTKPETFTEKKQDSISNDIAALRGARLVAASETESHGRLAESLVKQVTGGDPLVARFLHQEFFEFKPSLKLWLATNHKPTVRGQDHAIWRRIKLIPFDVTIPEEERDLGLTDALEEEFSGILTWALSGCMEWQKEGLKEPNMVKMATSQYRDEMDVLEPFFAEKCHFYRGAEEDAAELYRAYSVWCFDAREEPIKPRTFGISLSDRGLKRTKGSGGKRKWSGISLTKPGPTVVKLTSQSEYGKVADVAEVAQIQGSSQEKLQQNLPQTRATSAPSATFELKDPCKWCGTVEKRRGASGNLVCIKCYPTREESL